MDENFNSLAEEQKEAGIVFAEQNGEILPSDPDEALYRCDVPKCPGSLDKTDNAYLEKLADLLHVESPGEGEMIKMKSQKKRCLTRSHSCNAPFRARRRHHATKSSLQRPTTDSHICPGYIWSGELPPRNYSNPTFSSKIFVGGVPWDVTEEALTEAFSPYGSCRVEWPSKEVRSHSDARSRGKVTGYVYIVFETERSVKSLLQDCSQQFGSAGEWYFKIKARRNQACETRQVQVIPWVVSDSSYIDDPTCRLDPKKTVFVGALHGMITAHVLFSIMNELYGNVVFVGIDTDKHKYPIGSGRVTFRSHTSYFRAIESAFLEIRTSKFTKKVQIDPFLEDSWCMVCTEYPGPYFCRDRTCFRYYCSSCWQCPLYGLTQARHGTGGSYGDHRPLTRHAPRSIANRIAEHDPRQGPNNAAYLPSHGKVPVGTPLGGMAAVTAVAHGTVPRQQHHAYQYMQMAPAYPTAVFTPTLVQQQCRVGSNVATSPMLHGMNPNHAVNASSPFVQQRLY
ncbi:unnamed protein product [Nippostrongylus brasiliensis]|uniref:RRM domain-containing protein n=1 Tax=Nippostrongylus brasiliensis TaxID=27835 RepID=A0A0N4YKS8_NIPBR|nr:unnamed protein product [Nippostrongylus brasiliensis]